MKKPISFTFVLPVHNGMPYIQEQVASILAQDYPHFNLIILENASNDGTREFINSLQNPKITVLPSDHLLSYDDNWKRVSTVPKSEYLVCAMADDLYKPYYLSEIVKLIQLYPSAVVYRTNVIVIDKFSQLKFYPQQIASQITTADYLTGRLMRTYFETFQGYCFRSDYFDKTWPSIPINNGMSSDDIIVLSALEQSPMPVSPCYACSYRLHGNNISHTVHTDKVIAGYELFYRWILGRKNLHYNQIVRQCLPYFVYQSKDIPKILRDYLRHSIYPLFSAVDLSFRLKFLYYLDNHFFKHKEGPILRVRFGPIKLSLKNKEYFYAHSHSTSK